MLPVQSNIRYKTMLCRHFTLHGSCQAGQNCQFAHGEHEKRNINDPIPGSMPIPMQMPLQMPPQQFTPQYQYLPQNPSFQPTLNQYPQFPAFPIPPQQYNFKTQICKYFQNGYCKNQNCSFAHGIGLSELQGALNMQSMARFPMQPVMFAYPIPNLLVDMQQQPPIPPSSITPPFIIDFIQLGSKKDRFTDIMMGIVTSLETLFRQNQEVLYHLRAAKEGLKNSNFQICSEMLKLIIEDPSRTQEEIDAYEKIYNEAQPAIKKLE